MSTEAQLKAISNSELASGNQIPALKHRTVNNAIIEEMYDAQSRGDVLAGVQTAVSIASGDQVLVIRSGQAYLLDSSEFGFVDALADLTDVSIPTPANDQVLAYNTSTSKWEAKDVNTLTSVVSISGTATTNALTKFTGTSSIGNSILSDDGTTVTIAGDLSVNNDLTVGTINSGTSSDFVKGDGSLDSTTYQDTSEKDQANGYAPLDSGAKIPLANLPDSILGQVSYQGTWAASTNTPTLANPPASTTKGEYYVSSDDGTQFGIDFQVGDWIISNGTAWEKVDNTDAVTSVFGRIGPVVANAGDYDQYYVNLDGDQTITGEKTFSGDSLLIADAGNGLKGRFKNTSINSAQDSGYATFGFNGSNNLFFTKATSANFNGGVFAWDNNDAIRTYTLQDASGTLAFTSDLTDFVTLDTAQTITGQKTFTNDQTFDGDIELPTGTVFTNLVQSPDLNRYIDMSATSLDLGANGTDQVRISGTQVEVLRDLAVDTDTLFVDSSNNRVGIGTDSPSAKLQVNADGNNETAIFESTDSIAYIQLKDSTGFGNFVTGNSGDIWFSPNASEAMRIDSSGNVGIGTSSPSVKLEVSGSVKLSDSLFIEGVTPRLYLTPDSTTGFSEIRFGDSTDTDSGEIQYSNSDDSMTFRTAALERMRIDSSGNVGIGTSSPDTALNIEGTGDSDSKIRVERLLNGRTQLGYNYLSGNSADGLRFLTGTYGGSISERMRIDSSGKVGIGLTNPSAQLHLSDNLFVGSPSSVGSSTNTVASAVFAKSYNWLAITDSNYIQRSNNTNGAVFTFLRGSSTAGSITITASATSYNTSSDYRLKENVVPMEGALDRVDALKPSRFNFISDPEKTVDGFLAHEVQDIVPEAVTGEKDAMREEEYEIEPAVYEDVVHPAQEEVLDDEGNVVQEAKEEWTEKVLISEAVMGTRLVPEYQGIDQSKLVPLLVGAIQELKEMITNQQAEIETLKQQINGQ